MANLTDLMSSSGLRSDLRGAMSGWICARRVIAVGLLVEGLERLRKRDEGNTYPT